MASTTLAPAGINFVEKPGLNKRKDSGNGITEPQPQFHVQASEHAAEPVVKAPAAAGKDEQVRVVALSEYKAAARCLAEAFEQDDVGRYFVDTPGTKDWTAEQKWDLHLFMMECITYCHIAQGMVTTIGPDYGGVALW